jgi:hypothetical protein
MIVYKYHKIDKSESLRSGCSLEQALGDNKALDALFNRYAWFSSRKAFDDPFDSKIELIRPGPSELLGLRSTPDVARRIMIDGFVSDGKFTAAGERFLTVSETKLNEMIDSYAIYCASKECTISVLWSLYASQHQGFCVEFEFDEAESPKPVIYQQEIDSVEVLDLLRLDCGLSDGKELGVRIDKALHVKLEDWACQKEYRWILSKSVATIPRGKTGERVRYDGEKVKSIIFGCRMKEHVKDFIMINIPYKTVFKQAVEQPSRIEIRDFAAIVGR